MPIRRCGPANVRWSVALAVTVLALVAAAPLQAAAAPSAAREVPGGPWRAVDAAGWHTCAIRTDATLWCWGSNTYGKLGDGTTTHRLLPVQIGTGTWVNVSVGAYHTCAVDAVERGLWCWGDDSYSQLGDGTHNQREAPLRIGTSTGWTQVSAGFLHSCGVRLDGTAW